LTTVAHGLEKFEPNITLPGSISQNRSAFSLLRLLGREPKFIKVPIQIINRAIWVLDGLAKVFPGLEDAAEFGKIGRRCCHMK
jgi:hypothetical protein